MLSTSIGRLRVAGLLEGLSFLVLTGIAMPLKYIADRPGAVEVVGWIHGALFVIFCAALFQATRAHRWSVGRAGVVLLAALLPFGPFVIDGRLRREDTAY
jgi:integral membrane protein